MKIEFHMIDCYCFFGFCFELLATSCQLLFIVKRGLSNFYFANVANCIQQITMNNNIGDSYFISFSCYHFCKAAAKHSILLFAKRGFTNTLVLFNTLLFSTFHKLTKSNKNAYCVTKPTSQNSTFLSCKVE